MDVSKLLEAMPELEAKLSPMIAAGAADPQADHTTAARALVSDHAAQLATLPPFLRRILAALAKALLEALTSGG